MNDIDFAPSTSGWLPPPRLETGAPDYGVDTPGRVRGLLFASIATAVAAAALGSLAGLGRTRWLLAALPGLASVASGLAGASDIAYAKRGKLVHRDDLLGRIAWTGNERVLDIGTGGGLMMIGAAKFLTSGKAVGIDVWRPGDLTNNTRETTMRNAYFEGVVERVEVRYDDARGMTSVIRNSMDAVFAVLTLQTIDAAADREAAYREIVRVLRPGGTAIVSDVAGIDDVRAAFVSAGLEILSDTTRRRAPLRPLRPLRTIVATKPRTESEGVAQSKPI